MTKIKQNSRLSPAPTIKTQTQRKHSVKTNNWDKRAGKGENGDL